MNDDSRPDEVNPDDAGTGVGVDLSRRTAGGVRVISEHRECPRCGYDLRGVSVYREDHYGWYVARCAECGFVTPVHESKTSAKAVSVQLGVYSVVWGLFGLALIGGLGMAQFGMTVHAFELAAVGNYRAQPDTARGLFWLVWMLPIALPFGIVGALMSAGRGRRSALVGAAAVTIVTLIAWAFLYFIAVDSGNYGRSAHEETLLRPRGTATAGVAVVIAGSITTAVFLSSPWLARQLVSAFGPRWAVLALSGLWTGAGRDAPGGPRG